MYFGAYLYIKLERLKLEEGSEDEPYNYNVIDDTPLIDGAYNCTDCEDVIYGVTFDLPHYTTSGFNDIDLTDLDFPAIKKEFKRKYKKVIQKLRRNPDVRKVIIQAGWVNF